MISSISTGKRWQITHVTLGLDMGGLEKLLAEFARHADRTRFNLRFISLGGRGSLAPEIEACGWPVTALECPGGWNPALFFRLARLFRRWQTDVVHTHDDRPLVYGTMAARLAGVSGVFHTRHGQSINMTSRQATLIKWSSRLTDRFIGVSADSAALSIRQGVARHRIGVIHNGIDTERFAFTGPREVGPVVAIARLSPEKDVANLVGAAALAVRESPSLRFEIAGAGSCMIPLRQAVADMDLVGKFHLLGQVRDIPGLLERASMFVLPSLSEGISLTLLEAMAKGLPVIATRVGGNTEVVEDGVTGILVPPQSPGALAQAILDLRRDPQRCRSLGRAGRTRVEQRFDVRRMVAEYETLYSQTPLRQKSRNARDRIPPRQSLPSYSIPEPCFKA